MKKEDKDLLLKDLCARLPYGVKCAYFDVMGNESEDILNAIFPNDERLLVGKCSIDYSDSDILGVIPYLFPLSSMTEEQKEFLIKNYKFTFDSCGDNITNGVYSSAFNRIIYHTINEEDLSDIIDWLNANHFDYRGLIPKGLAIDATGLNIY